LFEVQYLLLYIDDAKNQKHSAESAQTTTTTTLVLKMTASGRPSLLTSRNTRQQQTSPSVVFLQY